jgi:DNA repair exonuclease SbcCD ATPase subunit
MNVSKCDLDFVEGINLIEGAVGEGKSSVFAAIAYVLCDYRLGDSWKDYVKTGEKSFEILLTYQFGNDPQNVMVVTYKGEASKGSVYKEILYQGETKKGEEVPIFLAQHLDQEMLNAVVFNLQGSQQLSQMTPAERRDIFKKIFNSDFTSIVESIKADKATLQKDIATVTANIQVLKSKEYNLFRIIQVDPTELEVLQKELEQAQTTETIRLRINQYAEKVQALNALQGSLSKGIASKDQCNVALLQAQKELEDTQKLILEQEGVHELKRKAYEDACEEQKVAEESLALHKPTFDFVEAREALSKFEESQAFFKAEIAINTKYISVHRQGKCPECGQTCDSSNIELFEKSIQINTELLNITRNSIQ